MTQLLSIGYPQIMLQNVVYAAPARRCLMFCDVAAAVFDQSNLITMVPSTALTPDANEQIEVGGAFLRCTSGNATVILKRM